MVMVKALLTVTVVVVAATMAVMVLVLVQEVKILLEDLNYVMLGNIMILENLLHLYPNYLGGFVVVMHVRMKEK